MNARNTLAPANARGVANPLQPVEGAAPLSQAILAQTRAELVMTLRRGESLLVTLIMPVLLLIFFGKLLPPIPGTLHPYINFLLPGTLTVAVMSTGMVSLGIATAYERYYGVLKRLGASPLPRWALIVAKALSVLAVEVVQIILLSLLGVIFFGWRPGGSFLLALPILLLGTLVFAGIGMLMAGGLRAEATLGLANGLYLVFLAIGGVFIPTNKLGPFEGLVSLLPPAALSAALRGALTASDVPAGSVLLLLVWAVVILVVAARVFRWE